MLVVVHLLQPAMEKNRISSQSRMPMTRKSPPRNLIIMMEILIGQVIFGNLLSKFSMLIINNYNDYETKTYNIIFII